MVGEYPTISIGDQFSYNSYHLLDFAPGIAEGSYIGTDEEGRRLLELLGMPFMHVDEPVATF